jgi:hypothetical protein
MFFPYLSLAMQKKLLTREGLYCPRQVGTYARILTHVLP